MSTTLAQISARCASSLIKKLSGSDTAKFIKFGVTTKGQPWIVYSIDGRKCSQFISKKEWDFTKSEVFFVSETRIASDTIFPSTTSYLSGLYSVVNLRKKSEYDVSYYRRNETTPAITNCGCVAGQFKKSCKHQLLVKHIADRFYDSLLEKRSPRSVPAPVPASVPAPIAAPIPAGYIHPAQKEADRVWAANDYRISGNSLKLDNNSIYIAGVIRRAGAAQSKYIIESASYGTFLINTEIKPETQPETQPKTQSETQLQQFEIRKKFDEIWNDQNQGFVTFDGRQAKRVSLLIADLPTFGSGYMIFETNNGNFLVKKAEAAAAAAKVPDRIASAVSEIRASRSAVASFPDVFGTPSSKESIWEFVGNDSWRSSLGAVCPSSMLEHNVKAEIALGFVVVCRTSKADYYCSLSADGKILKNPVPRSA